MYVLDARKWKYHGHLALMCASGGEAKKKTRDYCDTENIRSNVEIKIDDENAKLLSKQFLSNLCAKKTRYSKSVMVLEVFHEHSHNGTLLRQIVSANFGLNSFSCF